MKLKLIQDYFFSEIIKRTSTVSITNITLYFYNVTFQQNIQEITYYVSFTYGSSNYWSDFEIRLTLNTNT